MKRFLICLFAVFVMIVGGLFVATNGYNKAFNSDAEASWGTLKYVSLGDSIAEGYGLADFNNKDANSFVANSYAKTFSDYLVSRYVNFSGVSYAHSGDDTYELFKKLNSNTDLINSVKTANLITICIGANDILKPASDGLYAFLTQDADIESGLDGGLSEFSTYFPRLLARLDELNPKAKVIFLDVYNPYYHYMDYMGDAYINITSGSQVYIPNEKIVSVGEITETYLNGGINTNGQIVDGLNQRMFDFIYEEDTQGNRVYPNFVMTGCNNVADFSAATGINYSFKNYNGGYSDLINENLTKSSNTSYNISQIEALIDPHPTTRGHRLISDTLRNYYLNTFAVINIDFDYQLSNGLRRDSFINKRYDNLAIPAEYENYFGRLILDGYYDNGYVNMVDDTTIVQSDMNIYAMWENLFTVTFNTLGGTRIVNQKVIGGDKASAPLSPTKANGEPFVYWYYSEAGNDYVWNFNSNTIDEDITLYAKWASVTCLTRNTTTQQIKLESLVDGLEEVEYEVSVDASLARLQWYVGDELQRGETNSTFTYIPPTSVGTYDVYCKVNGADTIKNTVTVRGLSTARSLEIHTDSIKRGNNYQFSLNHSEIYNPENCDWYMIYGGGDETTAELIGQGTVICNVKINSSCSIYAKYGNVRSNYIEVEIDPGLDLSVVALVGGSVLIVLVGASFAWISMRRYKKRSI